MRIMSEDIGQMMPDRIARAREVLEEAIMYIESFPITKPETVSKLQEVLSVLDEGSCVMGGCEASIMYDSPNLLCAEHWYGWFHQKFEVPDREAPDGPDQGA